MKTVEVVYIGPAVEVEVPAANLIAVHGYPVTVTAAIAKSLLEQTDIWRHAYPDAPKAETVKKPAVKKPAGKTAAKAKE